MFLLKKLLTPLCSPFFVLMLLLLGGILLLWFSEKRQRLAKILVTAAAGLLLLLSFDPVARLFMAPLERAYAPLLAPVPPGVKWVVVLGAGHGTDPRQPPNNQLNDAALARLVEGIRIYRTTPGAKLLVSGGKVWDPTPHAEILARTAEALGVPRADLVVEGDSADTVDEARIIRKMIGPAPFVLVTSAFHMPRSMGLFEKEGMKPIAAPADPYIRPDHGFEPGDLFPAPHRLLEVDVAFHEFAGMLFAKLRGQM